MENFYYSTVIDHDASQDLEVEWLIVDGQLELGLWRVPLILQGSDWCVPVVDTCAHVLTMHVNLTDTRSSILLLVHRDSLEGSRQERVGRF